MELLLQPSINQLHSHFLVSQKCSCFVPIETRNNVPAVIQSKMAAYLIITASVDFDGETVSHVVINQFSLKCERFG